MTCALAAHRILDLLFPERCALCGDYLGWKNRRGPFPVCSSCAEGFVPQRGRRCVLCSMPLISEDRLCMRCRSGEPHYRAHHSLFLYPHPPVARALAVYKGEGHRGMANFFCTYLAEYLRDHSPGAVLVPVPCRRKSRQRRGFDQVLLLCRILKTSYGIPFRQLLVRGPGGREQKTLNREDRERNLQGAILPKNPLPPSIPKRLFLLDDVFTTGATANECARVLKEMGAQEVWVLTIAID